MSFEEEIIFTPKKLYKFLHLCGFLICLAALISYIADRQFDCWNILIIIFLLIGSLCYLNLFYYDIKRKIIITPLEIHSILTPIFWVGKSRKKNPYKILWTDLETLKVISDPVFKNFKTFYIFDNKNDFIHFQHPHIENCLKLVEFIENKTGKKFENITHI